MKTKMTTKIILLLLLRICYGDFLRGTYNYSFNKERENIINNYVNIYGTTIYDEIKLQMNVQKKYNTKNYSFYEFGCISFSEDMKNTEIIYKKNNEIDEIDYSFKVYSCYSHFLALSLFKKERNKILTNKSDYIPNNNKYNHLKYYYYEDLEKYSIEPEEIQQRINSFLLDKLDVKITIDYEKCCRVYKIIW